MSNYTEELLKQSNQQLSSSRRQGALPPVRHVPYQQSKKRGSAIISWLVMLFVIGGIVAATIVSETEDHQHTPDDSASLSSDEREQQCKTINALKPETKQFNKAINVSYFSATGRLTVKEVIYNVPRNEGDQRTYFCKYNVALKLTVGGVSDNDESRQGYYNLSALQVVGSRFESQYSASLDAYSDYFSDNGYQPIDVRNVVEGKSASGVLLWEFDSDYKNMDSLMLKVRQFNDSVEQEPRYIDLPAPSFSK